MTPRPIVGDSDEESWVLMQDNTVVAPSCRKHTTTWIYHVASDVWKQSNSLMADVIGAGDEIGRDCYSTTAPRFFLRQ